MIPRRCYGNNRLTSGRHRVQSFIALWFMRHALGLCVPIGGSMRDFLRDIRTPASWADYALAVALGAALAVLLAYGI